MRFPSRSIKIAVTGLLTALLALAIWLPYAFTLAEQFYTFEVRLTSTADGVAQVYYDTGAGYNEKDSFKRTVEARHKDTLYRFPLPGGRLHALRFDPIDRTAEVTLSEMRIVDPLGGVLASFDHDSVLPANEIARVVRLGSSVVVRTIPGAVDPVLELKLKKSLKLTPKLPQKLLAVSWQVGTTFAVLLLLTWATTFWPANATARCSAWAIAHPKTTLTLVGALAVSIQCAPVIFDGKSFVSPNNGAVMYYETFPTLPGSTDTVIEDAKGSDLAALFHQSLYYPSIEREALFKFHELPLWNRYFSCGVPLLGQAQSMFGSVFNFIPLIGDSSALSWDIRFLLDRWVFVVGLGLGVWICTRCLLSASLVTFVSVFIGFFGFRLVHMAQFGVEVAPWILIGWWLLRDAVDSRGQAVGLFVLCLSNWELIESGTVKEAGALLLMINLAGVLSLIFSSLPIRDKGLRLAAAVLAGLLLGLMLSPLFLSVVRALSASHTVSDAANAAQVPLWQMLGLFDDIFYGRLNPNHWRALPSVNFALLIGTCACVLWQAGRVWKDRTLLALLLVAGVSVALVGSIVPASWILATPFLRNLGHLHNIFSCVLVVVLPLLAGYGFAALKSSFSSRHWLPSAAVVATLMLSVMGLYFAESKAFDGGSFFWAYFASMLTAVVIGFAALTLARNFGRRSAPLVLAALGVLLWRHAQMPSTLVDEFVFNPHPRMDFRAPSAAANEVTVRMDHTPSRPAGLGVNMLTGYSELLGWESIYGVDAVRNQYYDELLAAGDISKYFWAVPDLGHSLGADVTSWHEDHLETLLPLQNALGVRYYLGTHAQPARTGLNLLKPADLDVFESPGAWPRAYFTNRVVTYKTPAQFAAQLADPANKAPFASLPSEYTDSATVSLAHQVPTTPTSSPARDYSLTSNSTKFVLDASSAGVAVLTETYYPDDFEVSLNGNPTRYFRVNHAFKGVYIPRAGTYEIEFRYRPKYLGASLIVSLLAALGLAGWLGWSYFGGHKSDAVDTSVPAAAS